MEILKELMPVARKEHKCMFCHGTITKGQKYLRQTNVFDGEIGDWICHQECDTLARVLGMYDDCGPDGCINDEDFECSVEQYISDEHYDRDTQDIEADWQGLTRYEKVKKILNELEIE